MNRISKIKITASSALFSINLLGLNASDSIETSLKNRDSQAASKSLNAQESSADVSDDSGIDNFDEQEGGNWYEKRILLKKAGPKRAKISKKVTTLSESAKTFIEKKTAEEGLVRQAFLDFGFTTTQLDEQINNLSKEIEENRQKDGLNEQEKIVLEGVIKNKTDLEKLKSDIDLISQLDDSVGKANVKLMQQIEVANSYEQKALELYDSIADVLDDKKAKSYYLQIETLLDNVEAIERYVNTQFANYIDTSINTIKELIEKVKTSAKSLQERGVILSRQFEEAQKAEQERLAKEKASKKPVATKGWFTSITDFIMEILNTLAYPFIWLYKLIFGIK